MPAKLPALFLPNGGSSLIKRKETYHGSNHSVIYILSCSVSIISHMTKEKKKKKKIKKKQNVRLHNRRSSGSDPPTSARKTAFRVQVRV